MLESDSEQTVDAKPSQFKFRENAPTPKRKLNAKTVLIAVGTFSCLSALALVLAFSGSMRPVKALASTNRDALPADAVRELPGNYAELAKRRPKDVQKAIPETILQIGPTEISPEEKLRRELYIARLKRAVEARQSDITFKQVRLEHDRQRGGSSDVPSANALDIKLPDSVTGENRLNPRDSDGRQDEKREFLERARGDATTLNQRIKPLLSPYQLMAGTVIPGVLVTGINSDLPGQILGQVSQQIYDTVTGAYLLVPQGTKIIGTYDSRVVYGQERVLIVWSRLIFPSGRSINLEGMPGVDMSGYAGVSDSVNNHYLKLLTGVMLGSVLGAGAQIAEGGTNTIEPSFGQLATEGVAKNINEAGQQITRKNLAIQPTLEIAPGYRFNIFVTKDLILEPYEE